MLIRQSFWTEGGFGEMLEAILFEQRILCALSVHGIMSASI